MQVVTKLSEDVQANNRSNNKLTNVVKANKQASDQQFADIKTHNADVTKQIEDLKTKEANLSKEVQANKEESERINSRMSSAFEKLNNVEHGYVECNKQNPYGGWTKGTYGFKTVTAEFSQPYDSPPIIFTSVRSWAFKTDAEFVGVQVGASFVNTTHVTIGCWKGEKMAAIWWMYINWISFPQNL